MVLQSLSEKVLIDLLKHKFDSELKSEEHFVEVCHRNENILCLKNYENASRDRERLIIKMLSVENLDRRKREFADFLEDVFTTEGDNHEVYLSFSKKGMWCPFKNNLDQLKIILADLAEFQVNNFRKTSGTIQEFQYKIANFSDNIISLERFKDLDKNYIKERISKQQVLLDHLFKDGILVKSVGTVFANNIFITDSNKCVFLDLGGEVYRSPVYDALMFIFALSDETFRQHHLKALLQLYYETFILLIKEEVKNKIVDFDFNAFEKHVKILLLIVKFETATYLINKVKTDQEVKHLDALLNNILYSLKYRQISYEDCLEAISKKLGNTKFELINYELVPLDEKHGHLGEYFILRSKIQLAGKIVEYTMFVKLLDTDNAQLSEIVHAGASRQEQFFFRTFIPLAEQYGLESLTDFAPKCYFDRLNDVIILEDLAKFGYKSFKPYVKLDYETLRLIFSKAARFHAYTLLLEDRMSKSTDTVIRMGDIYGEFLEDWIFSYRQDLPKTPVNIVYAKPGIDELIDSFADIPKVISIEEFHKRVDALCDEFLNKITLPAKQFRNVISHGDFYASNVLVKHQQNGMVDDCFIIDFQSLKYAPITKDVLMMMYFAANKEVRDKYFDILLEDYYQELKKIMIEFGHDINLFYTPDEYAEAIKYMKPAAIIAGLCYAQFMDPQEMREKIIFNEKHYKYYIVENRKEYIKLFLSSPGDHIAHIRGLIEDLYDFCIKN